MNIKQRIKQHDSNIKSLRSSIEDFELAHNISICIHDDGYSMENEFIDARFNQFGRMIKISVSREVTEYGAITGGIWKDEWLSNMYNINKEFLEVEA